MANIALGDFHVGVGGERAGNETKGDQDEGGLHREVDTNKLRHGLKSPAKSGD